MSGTDTLRSEGSVVGSMALLVAFEGVAEPLQRCVQSAR